MSILQCGSVEQDDPYGVVAGRRASRLACVAILAAALVGSILLMWASPQRAAANGFFEGKPGEEKPLTYGEGEGGPLLYLEGGSGVQTSPKVHVIFWGTNFEKTETGEKLHAMLLKLYEGMTGSAYESILTQYFNSTGGSTGRVGSTVTTTSWIDKSVTAPAKVTEAKINEEVEGAIKTNKWTAELNAQFVLAIAPGATYEPSLEGDCAYHYTTPSGAIYDFIPYQGDEPFAKGCLSLGNPSKNAIYKTSKSASHEFAEAATDPEGDTWGGDEHEIADLCVSDADFELPSGAYAQKLYDDHQNECSKEDVKPPHVYAITEPASSITTNGATLNGITNPEAVETHYFYEYGKEKTYGSKTAEVSAGAGANNVAVSKAITGLSASTTYHYRLVAKNITGTTNGEDHTFTTAKAVKPPENIALPVASPTTPDQAVPESTTTGTWANEPTSYAYQWERCNATGGECEAISGGTSSKYTPVALDVEHTLVVKVTATNGAGEGTALSKATSKVQATGKITEYSLPTGSRPDGITAGPDGNLWIAENGTGKIGKITTSGSITEYTLPKGSAPEEITAGPDGNLWFTNYPGSKIGKITTSGTVTEYALPAESLPTGIVAGPDGNLWFTDSGSSKIGKITTSGTITEYALSANSFPDAIAAGSDGNLWFTDSWTSKIGKISTSGTITEYALPEDSFPEGIASGPDKNLWFTDYDAVGKITTSGVTTEYAVAKEAFPLAITSGADGDLWFTGYETSTIGRITTTGTRTEYVLPINSRPSKITSGPDDNLWFTNFETNKVGKITP